jgi:hypothetical protein
MTSPTPDLSGMLEQWEHGSVGFVWRVYCPSCAWNSTTLPFPKPDAALHALTLHRALAHAGES